MKRRAFGLLLATLAMGVAAVPAEAATREERGYITVSDGTRLRYHVIYPADPPGARFPVLVQHEGYAAGTNAQDWPMHLYTPEMMARGYALLGVSVRGTGCSQGAFDPFEALEARDARDIIEWAGTVPAWSDGRIGMIGVSFGGIMQLLTAQEQPPHLKAIVPSSPLADFYRDVVYPGGIPNVVFPAAWTPAQKRDGTYEMMTKAVPLEGDAECAVNYAEHERANTNHLVPKMQLDTPFEDDPQATGGSWFSRSPVHGFPRITVPTFLLGTWQDEQLPARWSEYLSLFGTQDQLWVNLTNGHHARDYFSTTTRTLTMDFLDRFVRDIDNGFERDVPPLTLGMESTHGTAGSLYEPSWTMGLPVDFQPDERSLFLGRGGALGDAPAAPVGVDRYGYPMPASDLYELGVSGMDLNDAAGRYDKQTSQISWKIPVQPGGALAYTTPPLEEDMVVYGPASLDLWFASTARDVDVQATITEIRPDGQETYVQRGWLRASHRMLDDERSTALRPYHTHRRSDARWLVRGVPTPMRVEILPFAHAFRAGSRLRVWIDAPTARTGLWGFAHTTDPAINVVLHGRSYPSKLVVGVIPGARAHDPLPACDSLVNQPCRPDVNDGHGLPPSEMCIAAAPKHRVCFDPNEIVDVDGHALSRL